MKNINVAVLISIRLIAAVIGFLSAVSFVRAGNRTFNAQLGWLIGQWLSFGQWPSLLLLSACLTGFVLSIWFAGRRPIYPFRRVDYLYLLAFCCAGFAACANVAWQLVRWGNWTVVPLMPGTTWTNLVLLPLFAYVLALLALGELVARLRDRTLFSTIYWVRFFSVYSVWRPIGFSAFFLLGGQIVLLVAYFTIPLVLFFTLATTGAFTYCAAHMLDLAAEYDKAGADKIRAERFKSELITNVSHDIKTPLTSIINYVDLLTAERLQGQAADYVSVLVRKSSRLKTLIEDLMEASKAGTGNLRVEAQELNLAEIVGQVAGEFEDGFGERGLTLVMRQPETATECAENSAPAQTMVFADSRHLYRTLENLFSNATKYALEGTRVFAEITLMPHVAAVRFTLQNISAAPIEVEGDALTEQFIRGDKARNTDGSGLGLYIAKSLVELMGGRLDIKVVGDLFGVEVVLKGLSTY
ncbi:MAG: HAMP domain-containing histidine kinase [Defluviitaleaceae bacterium]|nr:HAMP domain-containing histidine kinase [Defluviitaleaceae bacterium]